MWLVIKKMAANSAEGASWQLENYVRHAPAADNVNSFTVKLVHTIRGF